VTTHPQCSGAVQKDQNDEVDTKTSAQVKCKGGHNKSCITRTREVIISTPQGS